MAVQRFTSQLEKQTRKQAAPTTKLRLAALLEFDPQAASAVGVFFGVGSSASHGIFCNPKPARIRGRSEPAYYPDNRIGLQKRAVYLPDPLPFLPQIDLEATRALSDDNLLELLLA
jgi:hypothetical protein